MYKKIIKEDGYYILHYYDALPFRPFWMRPEKIEKIDFLSGRSTTGRTPTWFIEIDPNHEYCLKKYCRGGLVRYISKDKYLFANKEKVRSLIEIEILKYLTDKKFPVPKPIAASFTRCWLFFYRAFLMTTSCRPAQPLSEILKNKTIDLKVWFELGKILQWMHKEHVYHADLNAHNILYDESIDKLWIIDFDKAYRSNKELTDQEKQDNINRLQQSLEKLSKELSSFHYEQSDFNRLMDGYTSN